MGKKFLIVVILIAFASPAISQKTQGDITEIKANLEHLASDELEGRRTLTNGEYLASEYIAQKFKEYGVKPFGDNGTYFQNFPLIVSKFTPDSHVKISSSDGSVISYNFKTDFIIDARRIPDKQFTGNRSDLVFAGFGITAPEFGYDDYAEIDVTGKTVFVLDDEPLSKDSNYFRGDRATQYSFWGTKWRIARSKGASGLVIIATTGTMERWEALGEWGSGEAIRYPSNESNASNDRIPVICITPDMANKLLSGEKFEYKVINELFLASKEVPVFNLNKKISFELNVEEEEKMSRNVVGIIEGNDPVLKNEYVSIGAHYDHEGIKDGEIYNGADDNASGTAAVMEVGRKLAPLKENGRSVILMLYSAEEKGLMGSKYLSENSDYVKDIIANINMDMVGRMSEDTLQSIGSRRLSTQLGDLVEEANKESSNFVLDYRYDAPDDPNRFYERSDHYNFAKQGIPVVFFFDSMEDDYHKPSDDSYKINYEKISKVVALVEALTLKLSNLETRLKIDNQN